MFESNLASAYIYATMPSNFTAGLKSYKVTIIYFRFDSVLGSLFPFSVPKGRPKASYMHVIREMYDIAFVSFQEI